MENQMMEQIIHSILLAFHNIALVGCAAAPFYNRALVLKRGQYGQKLHYKLDKVIEDTLLGNAPYCISFIVILWLTGVGMPLSHYFITGHFKEVSTVAIVAMTVKISSILGMMAIMFIIFFRINPTLKELFSGFSEDREPEKEKAELFFKLRARRKYLCQICLYFALIVLVASAFIGFQS
jgi:hypothetical protein